MFLVVALGVLGVLNLIQAEIQTPEMYRFYKQGIDSLRVRNYVSADSLYADTVTAQRFLAIHGIKTDTIRPYGDGQITIPEDVTIDSNLTIAGTVDGRDVSADGSKLDSLFTSIGLSALTTAEVDQLENINTTTVSATQWGYLGNLDQDLSTTSSPTFAGATVNGDITVSGTVDGRDISADGANLDSLFTSIGLSALTAAEVDQLENIGSTTISATQWGYLGDLDQGVSTGDSPTFAGLYTTGNVGIGTTEPTKTLDVQGNMRVGATEDDVALFNVGGTSGQIARFEQTGTSATRGSWMWLFEDDGTEYDNTGIGFRIISNRPSDGTGKLISVESPGGNLVMLDNGNVGIGTASPGGSSTIGRKVLSIADGTAPSGGVSGQVSLYSSGGELYVLDAAGNATLLSPHDDKGHWVFYSFNADSNKAVYIDMIKLAKTLEKLTGEKLVYETTVLDTVTQTEATRLDTVVEDVPVPADSLSYFSDVLVDTVKIDSSQVDQYPEVFFDENKGFYTLRYHRKVQKVVERIRPGYIKKDGQYFRIKRKEDIAKEIALKTLKEPMLK